MFAVKLPRLDARENERYLYFNMKLKDACLVGLVVASATGEYEVLGSIVGSGVTGFSHSEAVNSIPKSVIR